MATDDFRCPRSFKPCNMGECENRDLCELAQAWKAAKKPHPATAREVWTQFRKNVVDWDHAFRDFTVN